jgi:hypothetical protein
VAILLDYRERFPGDKRSDWELLDSFMSYLHAKGTVGRNERTGRWIVGELT